MTTLATDFLGTSAQQIRDVVLGSAREAQLQSVQALLEQRLVDEVCKAIDPPDRGELYIYENCTYDQQNLLQSAYREYKLNFRGSAYNSHPVAAASRVIEHRSLLDRIGYSKRTSAFTHGRDVYVDDIGGNPAYYAKMGYDNVHTDTPIRDERDWQRWVRRMCNLSNRVDSKCDVPISECGVDQCASVLECMRDMVSECKYYCLKEAQYCDVTARYCLAVHSVYDIPLRTLGDIMTRKRADMLYGTFIFSDSILHLPEGIIPGVNCHFRKSKDLEKISFSFEGDSSLVYTHDYSTYIAYASFNLFYDSTGQNRFLLELLENRLGVQYFSVTKVSNMAVPRGKFSHYIWLKDLKNYTRVTFFDVDYNHISSGDPAKIFKKKHMYVETDVVEKLRSQAFQSTEAKFKPVELFSFLMTYTGRIFFGSDVAVRCKPVPFETAVSLATAVYLDVFQLKHDVGKTVQYLIHLIQYKRDFSGRSFIKKLFSKEPDPFTDHPSTYWDAKALSDDAVRKIMAPLHQLANFLKKTTIDPTTLIKQLASFEDMSSSEGSVCMSLNEIFGDSWSADMFFSDLEIHVPRVVVEDGGFSTSFVKKLLLKNFPVNSSMPRCMFFGGRQPVRVSVEQTACETCQYYYFPTFSSQLKVLPVKSELAANETRIWLTKYFLKRNFDRVLCLNSAPGAVASAVLPYVTDSLYLHNDDNRFQYMDTFLESDDPRVRFCVADCDDFRQCGVATGYKEGFSSLDLVVADCTVLNDEVSILHACDMSRCVRRGGAFVILMQGHFTNDLYRAMADILRCFRRVRGKVLSETDLRVVYVFDNKETRAPDSALAPMVDVIMTNLFVPAHAMTMQKMKEKLEVRPEPSAPPPPTPTPPPSDAAPPGYSSVFPSTSSSSSSSSGSRSPSPTPVPSSLSHSSRPRSVCSSSSDSIGECSINVDESVIECVIPYECMLSTQVAPIASVETLSVASVTVLDSQDLVKVSVTEPSVCEAPELVALTDSIQLCNATRADEKGVAVLEFCESVPSCYATRTEETEKRVAVLEEPSHSSFEPSGLALRCNETRAEEAEKNVRSAGEEEPASIEAVDSRALPSRSDSGDGSFFTVDSPLSSSSSSEELGHALYDPNTSEFEVLGSEVSGYYSWASYEQYYARNKSTLTSLVDKRRRLPSSVFEVRDRFDVSRSAFKLAEIQHNLNMLTDVSSVLDLCAAPGGFSNYLARMFPSITVFTHYYSGDGRPGVANVVPTTVISPEGGDLTNINCVKALVDAVGSVDFVTADGLISDTPAVNLPLYQGEWLVAKSVLRAGGGFLLKTLACEDLELEFLADVLTHFSDCVCVRGLSTSPLSSERFYLFTGYSPSNLKVIDASVLRSWENSIIRSVLHAAYWFVNSSQECDPGRLDALRLLKETIYPRTSKAPFKLVFSEGDLLESTDCLAHCVAKDFKMGAGVALRFRELFGNQAELRSRCKGIGTTVFLRDGSRYVYYLVTKRVSSVHDVDYGTFRRSVRDLVRWVGSHGVGRLSIPKLGCGLDQLQWTEVESIIKTEFKDVPIVIKVFTPSVRDSMLPLREEHGGYVIPIRGDGHCCYYALAGNYAESSSKLRKVLRNNRKKSTDAPFLDDIVDDTVDNQIQGDITVVKRFAEVFNVSVGVRTHIPGCSVDFNSADPVYTRVLRYTGDHYDVIEMCSLGKPDGVYYKTMNYSIIDLTKVKASLASISDETEFYNGAANYCFVHSACVNGRIRQFIESRRKQDNPRSAFVLLDLLNTNDQLFDQTIRDFGLGCAVVYLPELHRTGYVVCLLTFARSDTDALATRPITVSINAVNAHVESCSSCRAGTGSYVYNGVVNGYLKCASRAGRVRKVTKLSDGVTCVKLYMDSSPESLCIFSGDSVLVPVSQMPGTAMVDCSVAETARLHSNLSEVHDRLGSVTIGLDPGEFVDVSGVVAVLQKLFPCVEVMDRRVETDGQKNFGFAPVFTVCTSDSDVMINAMIEYREYVKATVKAICDTLKPLHNSYMSSIKANSGGDFSHRIAESVNNKPDYGLICLDSGNFLIEPKAFKDVYQYGYDGEKLVNIESVFRSGRLEGGIMRGYVSVCRDTRVVVSDQLYNSVRNVDLRCASFDCDIELIDGVPGCGKTQYIVDHHSFVSATDMSHIVLTASKESCSELAARVAKKYGVNVEDLKFKYRTLDSFVIHFKSSVYSRVDTMWVDEGMMVHLGQIGFAAMMCRARHIKILGDRAQIPFVCRHAILGMQYSSLSSLKNIKVTTRSVSFRIPKDVAVLFNTKQYYKTKVTTANPVEVSMSAVLTHSINRETINQYPGFQVLTYLQGEKADLEKLWGVPVKTVHEYQGNQCDNILLVRKNVKDFGIYTTMNYNLVAMSRHRRKLVYLTVKTDMMYHSIMGLKPTKADLEGVSYSGGGYFSGYHLNTQYPMFEASVTPPRTVDPLKYNKRLREFVESHVGGSPVIPLEAVQKEVPVYIPQLPRIECSPFYHFHALQDIHDRIFPGAGLVDTRYDAMLFEMDALHVCVDGLTLSTNTSVKKPAYDTLTSSLRTACPRNVLNTQKRMLQSFIDRNGCVPDFVDTVNEPATVDLMVEKYIDTYIGDKDLFSRFASNPVSINVDCIEDWLTTQPPGILDAIDRDEVRTIFELELRRYRMNMKRIPKIKLEIGAENKFVSPQTIAYQEKKVNAAFCPIVKKLKSRLISVLKYDKVLFMDVSPERFEEILTFRFPPEVIRQYKFRAEVDIGKYDKSQGRVPFLFKLRLLTLLGFPIELISTWSTSQIYTVVRCVFAQLTAGILFQQKSGNAATIHDNTHNLLACLAVVFDLRDAIVFAVGDDSYIYSKKPLAMLDASDKLARVFNFESKLLKFDTPYFCSKFVFMTPEGRWVVAPDFAKLLVKLGRNDLVNHEHAECYRRSLVDLCYHYGNEYLYGYLSLALADRYDLPKTDYSVFFRAFYTLINSPEQFSRLYYQRPGDVIDSARLFNARLIEI